MHLEQRTKLGTAAAIAGLLIGGVAVAGTLTLTNPGAAPSPVVRVVSGAAAPMGAAIASTAIPVPAAAPTTAATAGRRPLTGVNVSGAEFGSVPGRINQDYVYPNAVELDYYAASGARIVRIPFRWERLQPALYGPLATVDRAALQSVVRNARARGLVVVLDMHDYARRRPNGEAKANAAVGTVDLGASALTDAWTKIAADYRDDPNVWLGLMNEPSGLAVADWWRVAQQLVVDLRGQRVTNKLLVPGGSWTGAHSWLSSGNAVQAARFTDPGRNYAFELHQYLDKDSSGTQGTCSAGSASRVDAALSWAEQTLVPLFFGEIAAGASAACQVEYDAVLQKLNASPAVIGWTAWGGGRWWNTSYMFRLAPVSGTAATPHMQMIQKRFR